MDSRKLRYARHKTRERILKQRGKPSYRALRQPQQETQAEKSPETYAEQNTSLYGKKYANAVKVQGRKLLIQQKEKEWQRKKFREQGARAEDFSSSEGFSLQARRKKQAHISSVLREKGYADRKYALPILRRKSKGAGSAGVKTAKGLYRKAKKVVSLIITGGSTMLVLLAVIIPLCAAAAVFGSGDSSEVTSNNALVAIAQSQVGNEGGETYWRWYGFENHVDWCAIFVSWCAKQAGLLDTENLPRYAVCDDGIRWFIKNAEWYSREIEPKAGMIIFFDWNDDGVSEHTGIVEKCEEGIVYTIEGNSQDVCRRKWYAIGDKTIIGYGAAR